MNAEAVVTSPGVQPGTVRAWLVASRPRTLVATVVPVAVGTACAFAAGKVRPRTAFAALVGAILIQIGTNLANDVFDFERGADTGERLGPTRAAQAGLLTPRQLRVGMWAAFSLATAAGVYLTAVAGPWVVGVGSISILLGIAYTGGPYPLGYNGLGDVFVFVFFGAVAVCGTACAQVGRVTQLSLIASLPVGALATGLLVVNNLRDWQADAAAGKRTLAVRWGPRAVVWEYVALIGVAYAAPIALFVSGLRGPWCLLPLATFPWAVRLTRQVARERGRSLNARLADTARLLLFHGAAWTLGIALGS